MPKQSELTAARERRQQETPKTEPRKHVRHFVRRTKLWKQLNGSEMKVWHYLCETMSFPCVVYGNQKQIAEGAGVSTWSAQRAVTRLRELGAVATTGYQQVWINPNHVSKVGDGFFGVQVKAWVIAVEEQRKSAKYGKLGRKRSEKVAHQPARAPAPKHPPTQLELVDVPVQPAPANEPLAMPKGLAYTRPDRVNQAPATLEPWACMGPVVRRLYAARLDEPTYPPDIIFADGNRSAAVAAVARARDGW